MNNAFHFILKYVFVLFVLFVYIEISFCLIFSLSPDIFVGDVGKRLDKKAKVSFKTCDVTNWNINNYNRHCQTSQ